MVVFGVPPQQSMVDVRPAAVADAGNGERREDAILYWKTKRKLAGRSGTSNNLCSNAVHNMLANHQVTSCCYAGKRAFSRSEVNAN